jgi:hypothetical protein
VTTREDATALKAEIEEIVRRVLATEQPRIVRRAVVAVQVPTVPGRGGTCTVVDSQGNTSFGVRWYEDRPLVGDNVLIEVPPPGGTRRILAIDRELLATGAAPTAATPAVLADPDRLQVPTLPDLPHAAYPEATTVLLTSENNLYRVTGSTWVRQVEGPAGAGIAGHWQRGLNNGDFALPPPDPTLPLNNDSNQLPGGWKVLPGTTAYWIADATSGSGGRVDIFIPNGTTGQVGIYQNVGIRSTATRNGTVIVTASASVNPVPASTHYQFQTSAIERDVNGTFLRQYVPAWDLHSLATTPIDFYNTVGQLNLQSNTDSVDVGIQVAQIGTAVADMTVSVQQAQLVIPDPFVVWPDLTTPTNPAALSTYAGAVWNLSANAITLASLSASASSFPGSMAAGGYVDLAEIAAPAAPSAGSHRLYPLTGGDRSLWGKTSDGAVHAMECVGQLPIAWPLGIGMDSVQGALINLIAVTAGNGGALAVPIVLDAPMTVYQLRLWNTDTVATLRTAQWSLYVDRQDGTNSLRRVVTGNAFSFTPGGAASAQVATSTTNPLIPPGVYWIVIRNTSAAVTFGVGNALRGTLAAGNNFRNNNGTGVAGLGASIDISAWTGQANMPLVRLDGSIGNEGAAFG